MPGDHDRLQAGNSNASSNITGSSRSNVINNEGFSRRHITPSSSRSSTTQHAIDQDNIIDLAEMRRRGARIRDMRAQEISLLRAVGRNFLNNSNTDTEAPISAIRSRPRASPGGGVLQRHRSRQYPEGETFSNSDSTVQETVDRLTQASSNLSSLLDEPIPRLSSDVDDRSYSRDTEAYRRHSKRRKLDSDNLGGIFKSYGYWGQVVSGPLKMDIVKCDGGRYPDSHHSRAVSYCSENILSNDKSVYCTESSKCNIILGHQGNTAFCLKKLVIKAPATGFTAPIQEGLIFISMTTNDLLTRTVQYHLREPSPASPPGPPPVDEGNEGNSRRPYSSSRSGIGIMQSDRRPPSRRADYSFDRTIPEPISDTSWVRPDGEIVSRPFPSIDPGDDSTPPPRTMSPPIPPLFNVTTTCDAPSGDEEEESHPAILADRSRRDRELSPITSNDEDYGDDWAINASRGAGLRRRRRGTRRATPSKLELTVDDGGEDAESEVRKRVDVLAPHARFFIEKDKSMVSVKFDPPVSGRYILLKLWSPARDQNIDIQSIIAHGFAGTRWFPAVQMM